MHDTIARATKASVALIAAFAVSAAPLVARAQGRPAGNPVAVPVTNVPATLGNVAGTFTGTVDLTQFAQVGNQIFALGTITGTFTPTGGGAPTAIGPQNFAVPVDLAVQQAAGTCSILDLDLGPIHLDLLGLVIDLSEIHLDITAQQGPGNLLGNLLCAIAGLLDNPGGALTPIVNLLNQLLAVLGRL